MKEVDELLKIMATLRDPERGCPWDLQQNNQTILPHTLEEVYELAEAIGRRDDAAIRDELGDLLFQIIFYARIACEAGRFDFSDVVRSIIGKLTRRHPHVFGDASIRTAEEQSLSWEQIKAAERLASGGASQGLLDNVSNALPALVVAAKLQNRAATVGFDWERVDPVIDKLREELAEICEVLEQGGDRDLLSEEVGDLLFACVNLARHVQVNAETALMSANRKFRERFAYIESELKRRGRTTEQATLEEMEALWQEAKGVRSEG
jgi:MazG family protein